MRRLSAIILAMGMLAGWANAILQVDLPATHFPAGTPPSQISGTMKLFGNPTEFDHTNSLGPDGFPLMYHLLFDYDSVVPGGALEWLDISFYCPLDQSTTTQRWTPAPFTVFYTPGPAFPVSPEQDPNFLFQVFDCSEPPPPPPCIYEETFDHNGQLPAGWQVASMGAARTEPWAPVQEGGSDWAMRTFQDAYDQPFEERLISPVLDLSYLQDAVLTLEHAYQHASSQAQVRYSVNGGLSWTTLQTFTSSASGPLEYDISSWADGLATARFMFTFTGSVAVGGASWTVDNLVICGTPNAPTVSLPVPDQPPAGPWNALSGTIGCTWHHPQGVNGYDLAVRVDANADGDYDDGGLEDWYALPHQPSATSLSVTHLINLPGIGGPYRFEFRARSGDGLWGYSGAGGQEGIADDWYVAVYTTPPLAYSPVPEQPQVFPWATVVGTIGCSWQHASGVRGNSLQARLDVDGNGIYDGIDENWFALPGQADAAVLVAQLPVVWPGAGVYRFELRARGVSGLWGYSGTSQLEGPADDWLVQVQLDPPTASDPLPDQPQGQPWTALSGSIGCVWNHPVGVDGASLRMRRDMNGDGDYEDGAEEAWTQLPTVPVQTTITVNLPVQWPANGTFPIEFSARSVDAVWGYSGSQGLEGPEDDWTVEILADQDPPEFSQAIPEGQPDPEWVAMPTVITGAQVMDSGVGVDASSLSWRVDWNHNGAFDPEEGWVSLLGYEDGLVVPVSEPLTVPEDGEYLVEFRAWDLVGNGPATSGGIKVRVDTTPPTASSLFASSVGNSTVRLLFNPTQDLSFARYAIHYAPHPEVTLADPEWSTDQDPLLGLRTTGETTVGGLTPSTGYWFRLWALDQAGNVGMPSNTVHKVTGGTPLAAITDLRARTTAQGVLLEWTPPTQDIAGQSPVVIERYDVHASTDPWFTPSPETRVASTTEPEYLIGAQRAIWANYRVVAVGSGPGQDVQGIRFLPPGSFTMGPDPFGQGAAHPVFLSRGFWLDAVEVTNQDFVTALQYALDEGLVTATASSVSGHGVELVDLDDEDCEIVFHEGTQQFSLVARSHFTAWGGPGAAYPDGYDPARHPVKEVTWYGAASYCDWRSLMEGLPPFYNGDWSVGEGHDPYGAQGYRLPTEAEWEYAARYNDGRLYPWGNTEPSGCDFGNLFACVGWSRPVASYPAGVNQVSLFDLAGNAVEYVNDFYADDYVSSESVDPRGPASGNRRVMRGGDFGDAPAAYAKAVTRQQADPGFSSEVRGFRVARMEPPLPEIPEFIRIQAGTFQMGSTLGSTNELPVHTVTLTRDYELGTTEVTNQQYLEALQWAHDAGLVTATPTSVHAHGRLLMNLGDVDCEIAFANGAFTLDMNTHDLGGGTYGPAFAYPSGYNPADHPVKSVTWYGAACFCDWRSLMEGLPAFYNGNWEQTLAHSPYLAAGYRLPTEAEWEFAARSAQGWQYPWGFLPPSCDLVNHAPDGYCVGWTTPVGSYVAGVHGFFDMAGNVWELTGDWFDAYSAGDQIDPLGPSMVTPEQRVRRGGAWSSASVHGSRRTPFTSTGGYNYVGFRLCRTAAE